MLTISYQLVMMLTILFHYKSIQNAPYFLFYHILIIGFVLMLPKINSHLFLNWLRDWNSLLIMPTNFTELHYLVHSVNPIDMDLALIQLDLEMFGVHPTVWLEAWSHPVITEYMQIIYATFYFLPLILGAIMYRKSNRPVFFYLVFVIVLGFYVSYLIYFIVPAVGPRFTLDHLQEAPLTGLWATEAIRDTLNYLENIQRDAFPSGHTIVTLLTMIYARKYTPVYYRWLLIIGISLIISTVYLRYHYVIDVIAGIGLVLVIYWLAPIIYESIRKSDLFRLKADL